MITLRDIQIAFLYFLILVSTGCSKEESELPTDGDGNTYDTIVIGTQTWLKQNLKTTKYLNGVSIPLVTDNLEWTTMNSAGYCWYNNQPEKYKDRYGALYNNWTANVTYLCPAGYHVPTKEDWQVLLDYLGGENEAGGKMKMTGNTYWSNNSFATNESGFSAVGGGIRDHNTGASISIMSYGRWWGTDCFIDIASMSSTAYIGSISAKAGYSIRCVKNK